MSPHSTSPEFVASDADRIRPVLKDAADVVRRRIDLPWRCGWKSEAADDVAATRDLLRRDGRHTSTWGEAPVCTVIPVVQMLLDAVVQHVLAVQMLLEHGGDVVLAIDAETRSALEAAGQIWWLLGRGVTARQRVARLYAQRRATALELEKVLDKIGEGDVIGYGPMPAALDDYYRRQLGLRVKRHPDDNGVLQWSSSEGQQMPGYTERVRDFVRDAMGESPAGGTYAYYCGAAHSELWRVHFGWAEHTDPDGMTTLRRRTAAATISMAAGVSAAALLYSAARAYVYFGIGAGRTELDQRISALRNATRSR